MNKLYLKILLFSFIVLPSFGQAQRDTVSIEEPASVEYEAVKEKVVNVLPYLEDKGDISQRKFKTDYKKKYKSDNEFDYSDQTQKDSLWKRFKAWLQQKMRSFFNQFDVDYDTKSRLDIFFRLAAIAVIFLMLYYIIRAVIQKDVYWLFKKKAKRTEIKVDDIELNLKIVDFPSLLHGTIEDRQYRLSVRYYYLWLLQRLQEQEQIVWNIEKTNSDYQNEIKDPQLKEDFRYLSYIYNNIWYGEFEISEEEFKQAKKSFDSLLKQS